jgi:hypothetical protein
MLGASTVSDILPGQQATPETVDALRALLLLQNRTLQAMERRLDSISEDLLRLLVRQTGERAPSGPPVSEMCVRSAWSRRGGGQR